eukprot:m.342392 g.342392  ORF g.342392 m.342392 type:complete len:310 (-) comp16548_c0_seq1:364-1293(-)
MPRGRTLGPKIIVDMPSHVSVKVAVTFPQRVRILDRHNIHLNLVGWLLHRGILGNHKYNVVAWGVGVGRFVAHCVLKLCPVCKVLVDRRRYVLSLNTRAIVRGRIRWLWHTSVRGAPVTIFAKRFPDRRDNEVVVLDAIDVLHKFPCCSHRVFNVLSVHGSIEASKGGVRGDMGIQIWPIVERFNVRCRNSGVAQRIRIEVSVSVRQRFSGKDRETWSAGWSCCGSDGGGIGGRPRAALELQSVSEWVCRRDRPHRHHTSNERSPFHRKRSQRIVILRRFRLTGGSSDSLCAKMKVFENSRISMKFSVV